MGVLLAEHRLERCLPAADRVVALDGRARSRSTAPRAVTASGRSVADPALAPPGGAAVLARRAARRCRCR